MSTAEKFVAECRRERDAFPLQPVTVKPMVQPLFVYDACYFEFEHTNRAALKDWYARTNELYPTPMTYAEFAEMQHEIACEIEADKRNR